MKTLAFAVLATFLHSISVQAASAKDGPNIVFILTDDQGTAGQRLFKTSTDGYAL
jgi:hypothetical protein